MYTRKTKKGCVKFKMNSKKSWVRLENRGEGTDELDDVYCYASCDILFYIIFVWHISDPNRETSKTISPNIHIISTCYSLPRTGHN